jgi:hypothetical protein
LWHFQRYFFSCPKCDETVKFLKILTNHFIQVILNSNMTDVTSGAGTAYPSEASAFTLVFCVVHIAQPFVFCKLFCRSLFVLFLLVIVLPALLRFTAFDSPISIPRPFFFIYIWYTESDRTNVQTFQISHPEIFFEISNLKAALSQIAQRNL